MEWWWAHPTPPHHTTTHLTASPLPSPLSSPPHSTPPHSTPSSLAPKHTTDTNRGFCSAPVGYRLMCVSVWIFTHCLHTESELTKLLETKPLRQNIVQRTFITRQEARGKSGGPRCYCENPPKFYNTPLRMRFKKQGIDPLLSLHVPNAHTSASPNSCFPPL